MEDLNLKLYFREIIYHNPTAKKTSVCGVFSYEAMTVEEANLGNLYIVGKISNLPPKKHKSFDFLLTVLASAIKRDFYADPNKKTEDALESALQGANIYLADFTKRGHNEWMGNLDFTCLAFSQNNIHIGQTGNMLVYLLRGEVFTNIARKFSILQKNEAIKTFSNIASGTLEENDRLIITTDDILTLASPQKIKELNVGLDSEDFYEFLKESLESQTKNKKPKKEPENKEQINSLACLILDAETKPPIKEKRPKIKKEKPEIINIDLQKITNAYLKKAVNLIRADFTDSKPSRLVGFLSRYNIVNYLIALFLIVVLVLSPYLVRKLDYEIKINKIEALAERINELIKRSEIALAYQDQTTAQTLLQQANNLNTDMDSILEELPPTIKEKTINDYRTIKDNFDLQENTINNVVVINSPEEIADLSKSNYAFNPQGMLLSENIIYLYEINTGFIDKISLDNATTPTLSFVSSKDTFKLGTVVNNSLFLLADPEKVYIYEKSGSQNIFSINPNLENTLNIKDMTSYGDNIYFLDTQKQTIWKYTVMESILSGSNWLKTESDPELANAESFAIDGSVYVSRADGTIFEYLQGQKVREIKPKVSPPLTSGAKLYTGNEMKNLYILDQTNKRIIAVNKKDNFTTQYISENFVSPKDFWVTDDENFIFLLDGLKIYKLAM